MGDDIETRLRERPENNPEVARMDISGRLVVAIKRLMNAHRLQDEAADTIARLRAALTKSVELQSHYARLLNEHDGGERILFGTADEWLERLAFLASHKDGKGE